MGDVVSIILVTTLVETLINTINEQNSIAEKPDSKDVEESMAKLSKESTKLENVVTDQKEQIKNNTIQISKFYENPKKTYDQIEDISHFVESQLNITDIAFKRVDLHLDTALDEIQYSQDIIISRIEVLLSEARQEIRNIEAEEKISNLKLILSDFYSKTIELNKLSIPERIAKLESEKDILLYLEDSRVPKQGTLYSLLSYLIKRKFAIPQNQDDQLSLEMLQLLCSGVQTYVYMLGFALQQYALLSDHYYRKNNVDKYNYYYMRGVNTFVDFSNTLTGRIGLLDKVTSVLLTVGKLDFIQGSRKDVTELMRSKMDRFWAIQNSLESSKKLFQFDIPNKLNPNLDFSLSNISIPISDWKSGAKVSYAVHLLGNSTLVPFTMISPWSTGYTLDTLANPAVPIYRDQLGRSRVIFRQIGNETPQIVATIKDGVQVFRDIDRDLFNAARELNDEDVALKYIQIYIENKANVNAAFANSQRAIHAAAENNKWKIARELIKHGADINLPMPAWGQSDPKGHIKLVFSKTTQPKVLDFFLADF